MGKTQLTYPRLPSWLRRLLLGCRAAMYRGKKSECTVCGFHARAFLPAGAAGRPEAKCPACGSLERHRLVTIFFRDRIDLFRPPHPRFLHVAPEPPLQRLFSRQLGDKYISADLEDKNAMIQMDITKSNEPDQSFDAIYCSHVLEHVMDDRAAIAEFYRMLKPGGWAAIIVPISPVEVTDEDPTVTDPEERIRRFGQIDHVRAYGPDVEDRLREPGFTVEPFAAAGLASPEEIQRYRLADDIVFLCTKPG